MGGRGTTKVLPAIIGGALLLQTAAVDTARSQSAFPQGARTPTCFRVEDRQAELADVQESMGWLTERIEKVPPSEAEYLKSETAAALAESNKARYDIVVSTKFYHPWKVWASYEAMGNALKTGGSTGDARDMAIGSTIALAELVDFKENLTDYIAFDRARTPRSYDESRFHFDMGVLALRLQDLVECSIRAIPKT